MVERPTDSAFPHRSDLERAVTLIRSAQDLLGKISRGIAKRWPSSDGAMCTHGIQNEAEELQASIRISMEVLAKTKQERKAKRMRTINDDENGPGEQLDEQHLGTQDDLTEPGDPGKQSGICERIGEQNDIGNESVAGQCNLGAQNDYT